MVTKNIDPSSTRPTSANLTFLRQSECSHNGKNSVYHAITKHIEVHHNYIRYLVDNQDICLNYCPTIEQTIDIMTKPLGNDKFTHRSMLLKRKLTVARFS